MSRLALIATVVGLVLMFFVIPLIAMLGIASAVKAQPAMKTDRPTNKSAPATNATERRRSQEW